MMIGFSRPKRPYKGQLIDLLAFVQNFLWKFQETIQKVASFWKKKFKKICSKASSLYLNSQLHGQFSLELPIRFTPNLNHMANFTQAFIPWKKKWPLKASKANKGHLSFCCLSLGNKKLYQSYYLMKVCIFCFCEI